MRNPEKRPTNSKGRKRVVALSSFAGLIIGGIWQAVLFVPFLEWPKPLIYAMLVSYPALLIVKGTSFGVVAFLLIAPVLMVVNAILYGAVALLLYYAVERVRAICNPDRDETKENN